MASLGDLFVTIGADVTGFKAAMGDVNDALKGTSRDVKAATSGWSDAFKSLQATGLGMTAAITAPLLGLATLGTAEFNKFELALRQVTSLLGGVSEVEFKQLTEQTKELAKSLGVDAVKAANALYEAISAGVPKENALDFVRVASVAAIAGLTDTTVAVDALTTIIAAYGLEASDAKEISDAMFQAVNIGKFRFEELASAIGPAAQQADNLGISYKELLAATATLSISSGSVGQAVTQIESAMRALLSPTKEMSAALKAVGFESGSAATKALGLEGTLEELRKQTGGNAEAFNALFGRIEGATGALGLTGDKAAKAAADLETMRHSTDGLGASTLAFNEINKSAARSWESVRASMQELMISIGQQLAPAMAQLLTAAKPLIQWAIDAVKWFGGLPTHTQTVALGFIAIAAAAGPLLLAVGTMGMGVIGIRTAFAHLAVVLSPVIGLIGSLAISITGTLIPALWTVISTTIPAFVASVGRMVIVLGATLVQAIAGLTLTTIPQLIVSIASAGAAFLAFAATGMASAASAITTFAVVSIPAAVTAIMGLVTVTIPAAITALIAFATAGVGAAITALTTLTVTLLPYVAGAVAIAAAAFAAWKLLEWAKDLPIVSSAIKVVGDVINWLVEQIKKIPGVTFVVDGLKTAASTMSAAFTSAKAPTDALAASFDKLGVTSAAKTKQNFDELRQAVVSVEAAFKAGNATAEDVKAAHDALAKALKGTNKAHVDGETAAEKYTKALKAAESILGVSKSTTEDAKKAYELLFKAWQKGEIDVGQLSKAYSELQKRLVASGDAIHSNVTPEWIALGQAQELAKRGNDSILKAIGDFINAGQTWGQKIKLVAIEHDSLGFSMKGSALEAATLAKEMQILTGKYPPVAQAVVNMNNAIQGSVAETAVIMRDMGAKSTVELRAEANRLGDEYERLIELNKQNKATTEDVAVAYGKWATAERELAGPSGGQLLQGRINALEDEKEAMIMSGRDLTSAQQATLDKLLNQQETFARKMINRWHELYSAVGNIVDGFFRAVSGTLIDALWGNEENDKLDKQAEDVRTSLTERTADFAAFQAAIASQLVEARQNSATEQEKDLAQLRDSLAEKQEAYDEYVKGTYEDLDESRKERAESLAKELDNLKDKLSEKQDAYDEYSRDVTEKIQRLTEDDARSLADQLDNLQDSLQDKRQSYEDYVQDVNTNLSRIGEDLQTDLQGQGTKTQRNVADKNKDFDRDERDTLERIDRLKKAGKKENDFEIQDLRKALARKREDRDEYNRRQFEDLNAYTREHQRAAERERADLQANLAQRTRDYKEFVAENAQTAVDVTAKHKEALARQVGDLRASLAERAKDLAEFNAATALKAEELRTISATKLAEEENALIASLAKKTAEHEKYKVSIAQKEEEIRILAAEKLAEKEQDLATSLAKETAEYEIYKSDVAAKLQEIKDLHTSVWGDIAEMLIGRGGLFAQIAESFVSTLIRPMTDAIGDFIGGALASLGRSLGEIFGGTMGTVGDISGGIGAGLPEGALGTIRGGGGAGGGVASAASGVASTGFTAVAGLITGAISAVTGVIGAFQMMGMNKSLDLVVLHTLQIANDLANLRRDAWDRELHLFAKMDDWRQYMQLQMDSLMQIVRSGGDWLFEVTTGLQALQFPLEAMAASGAGGNITIDLRGSYFLNDRQKDEFIEEIVSRLKARNA